MLSELLNLNLFHALLVFVRLGAVMMVIPGFSTSYIPMRVRLVLTVAVTLVLTPTLTPLLPAVPETPSLLVVLIALEGLYGLFLGLIGMYIMAALEFAGTSISQTSGLMNAMTMDPVTQQQAAVVVGLLSNLALVSVFIMDIHHTMLEAMVGSYRVFPPGTPVAAGDHMAYLQQTLSGAFVLGIQLAAPFIVFALVFQTALGFLARLSPQMNVFFVALPLQLALGLGLLWVSLPAIMLWFLDHLDTTMLTFAP